MQKYMIPMKTQNVVDSCLVDEIFYKINEIYMHHATFIAFLARAMHDAATTIGDVINRNVRNTGVLVGLVVLYEVAAVINYTCYAYGELTPEYLQGRPKKRGQRLRTLFGQILADLKRIHWNILT